MRRAIQRCSASVPRTLSAPSTAFSTKIYPRFDVLRPTRPLGRQTYRALHQTSRVREQAAAQEATSYDDAAPSRITRFDDLDKQGIVHQNIVRNLTQGMGLETMTDVQSATINEALKGTDIIAQARTGTGKTVAFLLPVLQNILSVDPELAERSFSRRGPRTTADDIRALIISPTRELAEQIATEAKKLVAGTSLIVQTAVGGTQKRAGLAAIQRQGCHILVGTPGRLKDLLTDPYSRVQAPDLSALVFDEADRLLDAGFWPEIQEIMHLLPTAAEKDRQTLMFSATVPREVVQLVRSTLKPGFQFVKTVDENEEPTHTRVPQRIVTVRGFENKMPALMELVQKGIEGSKQPDGRPFKAIVYYNSTAEVALATNALRNLRSPNQPDADQFSRLTRSNPHPWSPTRIFSIHAKLTQEARTRAAENFRTCESGILLSSDVTARGMDFPNVTHVIQMALPPNKEQYIHRIGRTARAGKEGEGWLIVNADEAAETHSRLRRLPLKPDSSLATANIDLTNPGRAPAQVVEILELLRHGMSRVDDQDKTKVYMALLGVYSWLGNKRNLIQSMNNLALYGFGMSEPPEIGGGLASKLGLRGLPGVRIGSSARPDSFGPRDGGRGGFGGGFGGGRGGFGGGRPREERFGDRGGFGGRSGGDRFGGDRSGGDRSGGDRSGGDRFGGDRGGRGGFGGARRERFMDDPY